MLTVTLTVRREPTIWLEKQTKKREKDDADLSTSDCHCQTFGYNTEFLNGDVTDSDFDCVIFDLMRIDDCLQTTWSHFRCRECLCDVTQCEVHN